MKRICGALLCALCVPLAAHAASPEVSAFAMPTITMSNVSADGLVAGGVTSSSQTTFAQPPPSRTGYESAGYHRTYESVRYRPRRSAPPTYYDKPSHSSNDPSSVMELHLGYFDPEGTSENGVLVGGRLGMMPTPNVTLGAQVDWHHKSDRETQIVSTGQGPGGETIVTNRDLARSSSDLLPLMGYLQLNMGQLAISPYIGVAGGYEVLFLSAEDFATGEDFSGTFDGFGWQAYGGASISLSGPARLNAEVFINRGELDRDFHDPSTGETFRESINVDGAGVRGGVSFAF